MKKIILVVEDQPEIRTLIKMTMEYGDFEVHEADNGESGLRLVKALKPRAVLLDVMMPGKLDGYEVCRLVREDPEVKDTPIILITARGQQEDHELGGNAGCSAYLTKPFSPLQLIEIVERLCATPTQG
jgi:CheY-like chemotaxis protein